MDDLFENLKKTNIQRVAMPPKNGTPCSAPSTTKMRDFVVRIERTRLDNIVINRNASDEPGKSPQANANQTKKRNSNETNLGNAKRPRKESDVPREQAKQKPTKWEARPEKQMGHCVVRLKKICLYELRDKLDNQSKPERKSQTMANKRNRSSNGGQPLASTSPSSKIKKATTPTKALPFSRSTLIKQFGKRYFNSYVKIKRCRLPEIEKTPKSGAKVKCNKNLFVSFCEHVEIMPTTGTGAEESTKQASTPQRTDEPIENDTDDPAAELSFNVKPSEGATKASTPLRSPKKLLTPLKDAEATPSPRKQELKKANEKLPPNGLRGLNMDDVDGQEEEVKVTECPDTVPTEGVDALKVNITTVAEIHQNPGELGVIDHKDNEPQNITSNGSSTREEENTDKNVSLAYASPAKPESVFDKITVHDDNSALPVASICVVSDKPLHNEEDNSTSSFASAEGQPHLDDENAMDTIRSFIDEKSNTDDGKALDDTNDAAVAETLPSVAGQFGMVTASPRPALHSFENKLHKVDENALKGDPEDELSTGGSECLRLFVDDDELKIADTDVDSLKNVSPTGDAEPTEPELSDYEGVDAEMKSFEQLLNEDGDKVATAVEPDV